jgi:hypothetical protein
LLIAVAIGATFIAIWFTKASDLYKKSEELWEGKTSALSGADASLIPRHRDIRAYRFYLNLCHGGHNA